MTPNLDACFSDGGRISRPFVCQFTSGLSHRRQTLLSYFINSKSPGFQLPPKAGASKLAIVTIRVSIGNNPLRNQWK